MNFLQAEMLSCRSFLTAIPYCIPHLIFIHFHKKKLIVLPFNDTLGPLKEKVTETKLTNWLFESRD